MKSITDYFINENNPTVTKSKILREIMVSLERASETVGRELSEEEKRLVIFKSGYEFNSFHSSRNQGIMDEKNWEKIIK